MPELPEVETIVNALDRELSGRQFTEIKTFIDAIRYPLTLQNETALLGSPITAVRRRARYIIIELANRYAVIIHLGMSGSIRIVDPETVRRRHEHIIFSLDNNLTMRFDCPRRFGFVKHECLSAPGAEPAMLRELGVEPLTDAFSADYFFRIAEKCRGAVKNLLMNNAVVVGVGNIYANEALFAAGIHPARRACQLTRTEAAALVAEVKKVLLRAIAAGGTTFSDYRQVDGSEGKFVRELNIYGRSREPCIRCGTLTAEERIGGRNSFFCPRCQR
jgi:formamidopyrimidine-DNA glycosylase